jgi:hypothetical protein
MSPLSEGVAPDELARLARLLPSEEDQVRRVLLGEFAGVVTARSLYQFFRRFDVGPSLMDDTVREFAPAEVLDAAREAQQIARRNAVALPNAIAPEVDDNLPIVAGICALCGVRGDSEALTFASLCGIAGLVKACVALHNTVEVPEAAPHGRHRVTKPLYVELHEICDAVAGADRRSIEAQLSNDFSVVFPTAVRAPPSRLALPTATEEGPDKSASRGGTSPTSNAGPAEAPRDRRASVVSIASGNLSFASPPSFPEEPTTQLTRDDMRCYFGTGARPISSSTSRPTSAAAQTNASLPHPSAQPRPSLEGPARSTPVEGRSGTAKRNAPTGTKHGGHSARGVPSRRRRVGSPRGRTVRDSDSVPSDDSADDQELTADESEANTVANDGNPTSNVLQRRLDALFARRPRLATVYERCTAPGVHDAEAPEHRGAEGLSPGALASMSALDMLTPDVKVSYGFQRALRSPLPGPRVMMGAGGPAGLPVPNRIKNGESRAAAAVAAVRRSGISNSGDGLAKQYRNAFALPLDSAAVERTSTMARSRAASPLRQRSMRIQEITPMPQQLARTRAENCANASSFRAASFTVTPVQGGLADLNCSWRGSASSPGLPKPSFVGDTDFEVASSAGSAIKAHERLSNVNRLDPGANLVLLRRNLAQLEREKRFLAQSSHRHEGSDVVSRAGSFFGISRQQP